MNHEGRMVKQSHFGAMVKTECPRLPDARQEPLPGQNVVGTDRFERNRRLQAKRQDCDSRDSE